MRCGDFRESYAEDMAIFESPVSRWPWPCSSRRVLRLLFATAYWLDVLLRVLIAVIAATGLNILTGFTGQISLGNAAFLAVGAYSTAFLAGRLGLPFPVVIPVAGSSPRSPGWCSASPRSGSRALPRGGHARRPLRRRVHRPSTGSPSREA